MFAGCSTAARFVIHRRLPASVVVATMTVLAYRLLNSNEVKLFSSILELIWIVKSEKTAFCYSLGLPNSLPTRLKPKHEQR
jgi:hypothetical protein